EGELEVGAGAGELVDVAALAGARQVDRDADGAHEEELGEERDDGGLGLGAAARGVADVADLEGARGGGVGSVEVVAQHELVGALHGGLRLVLVAAGGEGEELANPG